jgi:hypothetical protein
MVSEKERVGVADLREENRDGVVIEHHDDDALRLEAPEQRAAVERLGPARIRLEEDVALGKGSEVEIDAALAADVAQAAGRSDQLRIGKREIAHRSHVESDQPCPSAH